MIYGMLVLLAVGTLFLRLPRWLSFLLSLAFVGIGIILLLFGFAGSYWSSHMNPSNAGAATSTWVTGALLVLSRAVLLLKTVREIVLAPPFE